MAYLSLNPLASEVLKQKRTPTFWFVFLAPLSMAFLYFLVFNHAGERLLGDENSWSEIFRHAYGPINSLMLPLFIAVMTSLVHFTDHKNHTWKHLYALPVSKSSVFLSKSLFSLLMLIVVMFMYPFLVFGAGYLASYTSDVPSLRTFSPELWSNGLYISTKSTLAALCIWSIHNWLGYRLKSFAMPVGVGLIGTITSMVMIGGGYENTKFFPYSYSALIKDLSQFELYENPVVLGVIGGIVVFVASVIDTTRRDID